MLRIIFRRILISIPLLLAISFITFLFINLAPGNYFDSLKLNPLISEQTIKLYEARYHMDKPVIIQFGWWLWNMLHLDLGYSFTYHSPVASVIKSRLTNTLILSLAAMIVSWIIAIPLGVLAAVRHNRFLDRIISVSAYFGLSIPSFFLCLLLIYLASLTVFLPAGGMYSANVMELNFLGKLFDLLKHLLIPTTVIAVGAVASLTRITRSNMLEILRQDYITFARAKGLPQRKIIFKHGLRNAINPLITIFGYQLSGLLSGAALTEIISGWPGIGSVMLQAVRSQDLYLVMGAMLIGAVMLIIGNLVADILLTWVDPRLRHR
jgi:peptide/nickel transport system permease protein